MTTYRTGRPMVTYLRTRNAPATQATIAALRATQNFSHLAASPGGLRGLGDATTDGMSMPAMSPVNPLVYVIEAASVGLSAYHGYRRNNSVGWAIWWAFMGGLFPIITPAVAFAQGFGKRRGR